MINATRIALFALLLGAITLPLPKLQANDDATAVTALLILGKRDGSGVDEALKAYERNLKSILPFDSFAQKGQGRAKLTVPGNGNLSLGAGHSLSLAADAASSGKIRLSVQWSQAGKTYLKTTVVASRGQPTILAGPDQEGGKLLLLVVAR